MGTQRIGQGLTGQGPLGVALQDSGSTPPRVYVRDGRGLVLVLPVRADAVSDVRRHLENRGAPGACDVELVDDHGRVTTRWGSFAHPGEAAALGVVLLGTDPDPRTARVVA